MQEYYLYLKQLQEKPYGITDAMFTQIIWNKKGITVAASLLSSNENSTPPNQNNRKKIAKFTQAKAAYALYKKKAMPYESGNNATRVLARQLRQIDNETNPSNTNRKHFKN